MRSVESSFSEIENNLNKIYRSISSLKTQLRRFRTSDIRNAADERRRKLELERKKREQMII